MRALILAQGDGRRWNVGDRPYLGRPKQLLEVDGEALVHRTARQFTERGFEVVVVSDDPRMVASHGVLAPLESAWPIPSDMAKFTATAHLWSVTDRTVILWGDCYYTDEAADTISGHTDSRVHYFRRTGRSEITGCRWDESFAVSFGPDEHQYVLDLAVKVHEAWERGEMRRRNGTHLPIRNHYAAHLGVPFDKRRMLVGTPDQTVIDDWSDDIDSPDEYREWFGRHEQGRTRVAVCIPWFGGDEDRTRAWEFTRSWYENLGVPVVVGQDDSGGQWTNRARGCNNAVAQARELHDPEVLLIGDADTVIPATSLWAAAHAAKMTGQLVLGYSEYRKLSVAGSRAVYAGRRPLERITPQARWYKHVSGACLVTPDLFDTVGGFDERFDSWGGEDRAFWMACFTLADGHHRITGPAYHLWHQRSPERAGTHPNKTKVKELGHRYKRASGWLTSGGMLGPLADEDTAPDVESMRALIHEPGGPLAGRLVDA